MPKIETYQKQAKLLVRWHRERNYSVGEKVRRLERFRNLTDTEVLDMSMPLTLAQEVIAVEAGFKDWTNLKKSIDGKPRLQSKAATSLQFTGVIPILFVRDVKASANFYASQLGFTIDFLHGNPPFYAGIHRGSACLHLRLVQQPNFPELAGREHSLILASIEVTDVKTLFAEFENRQVVFTRRLARQAWGGLDFHVVDPDGNVISFVEYLAPTS